MTTPDIDAIVRGLSEDEKDRLIYGRRDWRADRWQDHCGDPNCDHCTGLIPDAEPQRLSAEDQALRQHILKDQTHAD